MNHGSLFSGMGGFDLAAEWMGWNNIFHCEWNPFGQKVLKHYWPYAKSYSDITKTDFTIHRGAIDIISGGFPCQPYSVAGKRKGKEDDRHLWPEMLRAIREIQPRWVVGENVPGLLNWNGGMVLDEIKADLEASGFEVFPPLILPACSVNAPHRRDRLWIVAYAESDTRRNGIRDERQDSQTLSGKRFNESFTTPYTDGNVHKGGLEFGGHRETEAGSERKDEQQRGWNENRQRVRVEFSAGSKDATNTCNQGLQRSENNGSTGIIRKIGNKQSTGFFQPDWQEFPTQSPLCSGNDGFSPRLDGITFSKWRNESIKAGGNAVVPQLVYQIFKAIESIEKSKVA